MSFEFRWNGVLSARGPGCSLVLILMMALASMTGCKTGGEGSSNSTGTGSSTGSGGSRGSAGDFEGVIKTTMSFETKAVPVIYYIRPDRVRTETAMPEHPESPFIQITDFSKGKTTSLMPIQKTYMTTDLSELMKAAGQGEERPFPKLTATGQKETIAGYTCEHYLMGDQQNMDICVAKGLGFFGIGGSGSKGGALNMMFSTKMKEDAAANPEWSKFLEGGAFPLKMSVTEGGKTTMTSEVSSIERKKLDDSLFTVPVDYKEFKAPGSMAPIPGKTSQ